MFVFVYMVKQSNQTRMRTRILLELTLSLCLAHSGHWAVHTFLCNLQSDGLRLLTFLDPMNLDLILHAIFIYQQQMT